MKQDTLLRPIPTIPVVNNNEGEHQIYSDDIMKIKTKQRKGQSSEDMSTLETGKKQ